MLNGKNGVVQPPTRNLSQKQLFWGVNMVAHIDPLVAGTNIYPFYFNLLNYNDLTATSLEYW